VDDVTRFNQERWNALVEANLAYTRPKLDLTPESARSLVDEQSLLGEVTGKDVLCLASGGGQQSVAFALLGAHVAVVDFSKNQLQRDKEALAHYNLQADVVHGDMRDLRPFSRNSFDIVWHAYSINFIPDITPVLNEVVRVLRPGGLYRLEWSNPFVIGLSELDWNGNGYLLTCPYHNGELIEDDTYWQVEQEDGSKTPVMGPKMFNHTLSTVINSLIECNLQLLGLWEALSDEENPEPGSWNHFKQLAPPYLTIWARNNK
jgi:ubiquinone/menaquinone biosynthesis C-methylase UbiE